MLSQILQKMGHIGEKVQTPVGVSRVPHFKCGTLLQVLSPSSKFQVLELSLLFTTLEAIRSPQPLITRACVSNDALGLNAGVLTGTNELGH